MPPITHGVSFVRKAVDQNISRGSTVLRSSLVGSDGFVETTRDALPEENVIGRNKRRIWRRRRDVPKTPEEQAFFDAALIALMAAMAPGEGTWEQNAGAAGHGAKALLVERRKHITYRVAKDAPP
jgi:hypothetical protein